MCIWTRTSAKKKGKGEKAPSKCLKRDFFFFPQFLPEDMVIDFTERGREGEKERGIEVKRGRKGGKREKEREGERERSIDRLLPVHASTRN